MTSFIQRFRSDFNTQIKVVQLINIMVSVFGLGYLILVGNLTYGLIALLTFLIFGIIGANVGLHRYFSHRSFKTGRPVEIILAVIGTLTTLGSIISWVAVHRYHHQHADSIEDPHSPRHIGWWRAYTYQWNRTNISRKYIRDVASDSVIIFLHRHFFKVILVYVALLAIIDPWLIIFAYCIPATGCLNGVAAVTVIGHIHGYRTHETNDTARNSWIATIFSLGEGWHNNHHAHGYKWKHGERWWELDPPSWIIRMIKQ
jgi:fatty-acid desaturase